MLKKLRCSVCGYRFVPARNLVYQAKTRVSALQALTERPTVYDAMDCPHCGCQISLKIRDEVFNKQVED